MADPLVRATVIDGPIVRRAEGNRRYDDGDEIPELPLSEAEWLNRGTIDRVAIVEYHTDDSPAGTDAPGGRAAETTTTAAEAINTDLEHDATVYDDDSANFVQLVGGGD